MQEGRQASLAADFSITQFKHIGRLLMVHGRSSYKRSAALGQFVMHRGLIISTMQVPGAQARGGVGPQGRGFVVSTVLVIEVPGASPGPAGGEGGRGTDRGALLS